MAAERVSIKVSQEVVLEGVLRPGSGEDGRGALVLHPHPLYGGSMDNNVVEALLAAAAQSGRAGLRFNFRGVGASTGTHGGGRDEVEDVLAALAWLEERGYEDLVLMGYSFGSLVGAQAAGKWPRLQAGVWISPPLSLGELAPWPQGHGPLLIMCGQNDQFTSLAGLEAHVQQMGGARGRLKLAPGGDHFWMGKESVLIEEVAAFIDKL